MFRDDERFAIELQNQELSKLSSQFKQLEEQANIALARLMEATDRRETHPYILKDLENNYRNALETLELTKTLGQTLTTQNSITEMQSKLEENYCKYSSAPHLVKALQTFSKEEKELIKNHYEKIPEDLKNLFDAALSDEYITLDMIINPVFIRGDGHIYDLSTVEKMLATGGKCPLDQSKQFTIKDIIPCNTLIRTIQILLNIIKGEEIKAQPIETNYFYNDIFPETQAKKTISLQEIRLIENFYQYKLPIKHQRLFDTICRDPLTNMIMDDPVFLPDGYAYNRSTALLLLESAKPMKSTPCYRNPSITFTEEDITNCYLIASVYEHLQTLAGIANVTPEINQSPSIK